MVYDKLKRIGQKQNYLARKLKISPAKLDNMLKGKTESLGVEKKIEEWLVKKDVV